MNDRTPLLGSVPRSEQIPHLRIMLIGKTGAGKSTSGNTILGSVQFKSEFSPNAVTQECKKGRRKEGERRIDVIDTPGFFHTNLSNTRALEETARGTCLTSPGPHVFLVVLHLGRFTQEEKETVELIQRFFGESAFDYTMVLFTHGDLLRGKSIEDFIRSSDDLTDFVRQCRGRYHVFDNNETSDRTQVTELLEKIDNMVLLNGGRWFTNDLYPQVERVIIEEQERILREREEEIQRMERELESDSEREELRQRERERARERAEKRNNILKYARMVAGSGVGVAAVGAAVAAGVEFGTAVGLLGGPVGMVVGATVGLAGGLVVGTAAVIVMKLAERAENAGNRDHGPVEQNE